MGEKQTRKGGTIMKYILIIWILYLSSGSPDRPALTSERLEFKSLRKCKQAQEHLKNIGWSTSKCLKK